MKIKSVNLNKQPKPPAPAIVAGFLRWPALHPVQAIATAFLLLVSQLCFAGSDTNIIAISDWSKPVSSVYGHSLRARMIVTYGRSAAFAGPAPETQVFLEFQNVSGAIVLPTQFYFDPSSGLCCVLQDAGGNPVSPRGSGSGGGAGAAWITLPYDSTIRLRANMYGYGSQPGAGLNLTLYPPQAWLINAGDTNVYYLSGTITATTPTNFVPQDFEAARAVWSGTLELPKMKISAQKP